MVFEPAMAARAAAKDRAKAVQHQKKERIQEAEKGTLRLFGGEILLLIKERKRFLVRPPAPCNAAERRGCAQVRAFRTHGHRTGSQGLAPVGKWCGQGA